MATIFQKLAELRNLAREGAPVDAGELASVEAAARAEQSIDELKAEGERTRAEEQAAREHQARKAEAAATVREAVAADRDRLTTAEQALRDAIAAYADAIEAHNGAVRDAVKTLQTAGFPAHNESSYGAIPTHHPDYDAAMMPILASAGPTVKVDGQRIGSIDAGQGLIFAASRDTRVSAWIGKWRRSRDTYPITNPNPWSDEDRASL